MELITWQEILSSVVLYAPGKKMFLPLGISTIGQQPQALMNITPDSKRFWIKISGLAKGNRICIQYLIDGSLKVADPYTEKCLTRI